jgi:DNA-binding transcriptional MocR family regulator
LDVDREDYMARHKVSRAEEIANTLRRQIADGAFRPGEKLPSIREVMASHGYSKNTVVDAFERLVAAGQIEPRRGSGYYVTQGKRTAVPEVDAGVVDRALDTIWMMREQLNDDPNHLPIGQGIPPREWLAENRLDKFHQKILRTGLGNMYEYGSRFGYLPLRQFLERKLDTLGIVARPNQIVLTNGANQAMDIIIRCLTRPGDTVLVDEPGYYPLYGKLILHGARIVGVPRMADGPDVVALEHLLETTGAKLFFTQSVSQNPTGSDTTPAKAHKILQLAERFDILIVENDPLAEIKPAILPRISTLDHLNRTIYIGSFTKTVSAALRVGFIASHPDLADKLADIKMLIQVSTSEYGERALDVILRDAHYRKHVSRLRDRLERATQNATALFDSLGAQIFASPEQTLYLWVALPWAQDSMELAKRALAKAIALAPGALFFLGSQTTTAWCRYNVGYVSDQRFVDFVRSKRT